MCLTTKKTHIFIYKTNGCTQVVFAIYLLVSQMAWEKNLQETKPNRKKMKLTKSFMNLFRRFSRQQNYEIDILFSLLLFFFCLLALRFRFCCIANDWITKKISSHSLHWTAMQSVIHFGHSKRKPPPISSNGHTSTFKLVINKITDRCLLDIF